MSKLNEKTVIHPKYRIMELIRNNYGELNVKTGIDNLAAHCRLRNKRTVSDWINIEAGSSESISHHLLPGVLSFFGLKREEQIFSSAHKNLLTKKPLANAS